MSRRLSEMTDSSLASGDRSAARAIESAGFEGELKAQLEERVKASMGGQGDGARRIVSLSCLFMLLNANLPIVSH